MDNFEGSGRAPSTVSTVHQVELDSTRISADLLGLSGENDPFVCAVRATRMPMIITNPRLEDNPVVFTNDAFCRLAGYTREEIIGRNCRFLQGPQTDPETVAKIREAVRAVKSIEIDIRNHRKDGTPFWNRLLLAPVHDAAGDLAYFFASQVDVTIERERLAGLESHNAALTAELSDRLRMQENNAAKLHFATEVGRLGIWDLNLLTEDLTTSRRCRQVFGRDPDEAFSHAAWCMAVHPDDRERVGSSVALSIAAGSDYNAEYRIDRPDGTVGWVEVRAEVEVSNNGVARRLAGVSLDITARKRVEERIVALAALDKKLLVHEDPAELAYSAAELLGRTLGVSRAGYGTVNLKEETITIERDWNAAGIRTLAGVLRFRDYGSYIEDLKRGETAVVEDAEQDERTRTTAANLKLISAQSFINMPVTEQEGLVALLYLNHEVARRWTQEDLTFVREVANRTRMAVERRRAEKALRAKAEDFEALGENVNQLAWMADPDGHVFWYNKRWYSYTGTDSETMLDRGWSEVYHPDHRERIIAELSERWKAGRAWEDTYLIRSTDGTFRPFLTRAEPIRNEAGTLMRWFGTNTDITAQLEAERRLQDLNDTLEQRISVALVEREAIEQTLRQSQKMEAVGQLTGGLAHDFNNLLTGITGSLELLVARIGQGRINDLERYVNAAQGAARRAAALTHRLLAFSRRQTLEPRPTDVNRLIAGMEELIRRTVGPEIAIEMVGSAGLWPALVDPNQLENALLNLCINARDAMPDGGRLTVETANKWLDERMGHQRELPPGQYLSLCVSDTGTGMTPETASRAFEPFFTTKPIGMGTGLGLSMIYGFARQSGGQVRIYSELGHGTTMCIYLPRYPGTIDSSEINVRAGGVSLAEQGQTVLIVDDEPTVRMLVTEILEDLGYVAIEAADGAAGLKVLQSDVRLDLLVTDVGLPGGMNGRQVADAGRSMRPDLKVLFITGYAENAVLSHGHLDPGMQVLTKPFSMDAMAARIKELIVTKSPEEKDF